MGSREWCCGQVIGLDDFKSNDTVYTLGNLSHTDGQTVRPCRSAKNGNKVTECVIYSSRGTTVGNAIRIDEDGSVSWSGLACLFIDKLAGCHNNITDSNLFAYHVGDLMVGIGDCLVKGFFTLYSIGREGTKDFVVVLCDKREIVFHHLLPPFICLSKSLYMSINLRMVAVSGLLAFSCSPSPFSKSIYR